MLVLTRKVKETLIIGDQIKLTVIAIEGDKVKIAVEAPKDISIHRLEVFEAIRRENAESAKISPDNLGELQELLPLVNQQKPDKR